MYYTKEEASDAADAMSIEIYTTNRYIDFDGDNCESCEGWDGNDRRCECGNRRVSWTISETSKGIWEFYAEAW